MKEYDSLSDNEKRNMLASVANLYYNAEMTQNQIAERFFTSRSKISRMLKEARQLGIVEIKILEPWDRNVELEQEFMRRFALKDVRVISVKEANNTMVLQKLGEVAAYYLDNLLNDNMILGISWGNTIEPTLVRMISAFFANSKHPLIFGSCSRLSLTSSEFTNNGA